MFRSEQLTCGCALSVVPIRTGQGVFTAYFTARGLAGLDFPPTRPKTKAKSPAAHCSGHLPRLDAWTKLTTDALQAVLVGKKPRALPPLDWQGGTEFQQKVWAQLRAIPLGQTRSYGAIAAAVGSPKGARAVGGACGSNPIPVLVPCHRVLAVGGRLGGFSGGLDWKKRLLEVEGLGLAFRAD